MRGRFAALVAVVAAALAGAAAAQTTTSLPPGAPPPVSIVTTTTLFAEIRPTTSTIPGVIPPRVPGPTYTLPPRPATVVRVARVLPSWVPKGFALHRSSESPPAGVATVPGDRSPELHLYLVADDGTSWAIVNVEPPDDDPLQFVPDAPTVQVHGQSALVVRTGPLTGVGWTERGQNLSVYVGGPLAAGNEPVTLARAVRVDGDAAAAGIAVPRRWRLGAEVAIDAIPGHAEVVYERARDGARLVVQVSAARGLSPFVLPVPGIGGTSRRVTIDGVAGRLVEFRGEMRSADGVWFPDTTAPGTGAGPARTFLVEWLERRNGYVSVWAGGLSEADVLRVARSVGPVTERAWRSKVAYATGT